MFASVIMRRQVFVDQNSDVSLIRKVKLVAVEYYANKTATDRPTVQDDMQIIPVEMLTRRKGAVGLH